MNRGTTHWNFRFTDRQIKVIRRIKWPTSVIARAYGISPGYVRQIRRGHARKQVN